MNTSKVFATLTVAFFCGLTFAQENAHTSSVQQSTNAGGAKPVPANHLEHPSKWSPDDQLTLEQAKARFNKLFDIKKSATISFVESPFEGWFVLMEDVHPIQMFNADLSVTGLFHTWHKRVNGKKVVFTEAETAQLMRELRSRIKPNAIIPAWQTDATSTTKATPQYVMFTAPNCPACLDLDANLNRLGTSVKANIVTVPVLLGKQLQTVREFGGAMLCSANPQTSFSAAFASRGRGQVVPPTDCRRELWPELVAMTFYPSHSTKVNFLKGTSYPSIFNMEGQSLDHEALSKAKTAKDVHLVLAAANTSK